MAGAHKKLKALPKLLKTSAMPVAVVRSFGGNQADDTAEGAENTTIPAIPLRIAHKWHILKQKSALDLSRNRHPNCKVWNVSQKYTLYYIVELSVALRSNKNLHSESFNSHG